MLHGRRPTLRRHIEVCPEVTINAEWLSRCGSCTPIPVIRAALSKAQKLPCLSDLGGVALSLKLSVEPHKFHPRRNH